MAEDEPVGEAERVGISPADVEFARPETARRTGRGTDPGAVRTRDDGGCRVGGADVLQLLAGRASRSGSSPGPGRRSSLRCSGCWPLASWSDSVLGYLVAPRGAGRPRGRRPLRPSTCASACCHHARHARAAGAPATAAPRGRRRRRPAAGVAAATAGGRARPRRPAGSREGERRAASWWPPSRPARSCFVDGRRRSAQTPLTLRRRRAGLAQGPARAGGLSRRGRRPCGWPPGGSARSRRRSSGAREDRSMGR